MRYFLDVAREGGVTHAAERLHISQTTLSKQLKDLDAEPGKTDYLFESVMEYDIDEPKRYDMKFGGAKQLILSGYNREKIRVRLAAVLVVATNREMFFEKKHIGNLLHYNEERIVTE